MVESVSGGVLSFFKDEHVPGWHTMIRIEFRADEIERLRRERFGHPHLRVQRKMEALLLKSEGLPHHQITRAEFTSFSGAIMDCLAQTHTQHKATLDSLLTLRFQTLQEPQNVAA